MAMMMALFVMTVCSMIIITILDTQTLQFTALRNTMDYDRARYLAESGVQHSLAFLEDDYELNGIDTYDIPWTNAPDANSQYMADLTEGANGTVIIAAQGRSGNFTRRLEITVKMGG
jgi:type II secretory pathway component PulK